MTLSDNEIKAELIQIIDEQGPDFVLSPKTKSIIRSKFGGLYPDVEVPKIASILNTIVKERASSAAKPDAPPVHNKSAVPPQQVQSKPIAKTQSKAKSNDINPQITIAKRTIIQAATGSKARSSSDVSCSPNTLSANNNINVEGSLFNSISSTPVNKITFNEDNEILSSMTSLVDLLSPDNADEFWKLHNTYSNVMSELDNKYALDKGKKQAFVFTDKSRAVGRKKTEAREESNPKVTYINPNTGKKAELEEDEAKPIIEYFTFMKKFAKEISDAKVSHIQYLCEPVINTQNIFKIDWLTKLVDPIPQNTNKALNMVLIDESFEKQKSDTAITNAAPYKYETDYVNLFIDIREFNGSRLPQLVKKIYSHRHGIVGRIPNETKLNLWKQAYANLRDFDKSNLHSTHEEECIKAWLNILSSRFAYHVVMDCIPASDLFEKSFNGLITEGISIHLFSTSLYPISFAFTPFMLFADNTVLPNLNGISTTVYRNNVKNVFLKMQEPSVFDYSKNNWVYYLENSNATQNEMIRLLDHSIKDVKTTEPRDEKIEAMNPESILDADTIADAL